MVAGVETAIAAIGNTPYVALSSLQLKELLVVLREEEGGDGGASEKLWSSVVWGLYRCWVTVGWCVYVMVQ